MKETNESSRRGFLKKLGTTTAAVAIGSNLLARDKHSGLFTYLKRSGNFGPNDNINLALIGAGGQGTSDTKRHCRCRA